MKKTLTTAIISVGLVICIASLGFPAQQMILSGFGVYWEDDKGKINANFTELYARSLNSNANTICNGDTVYLDGEGNCDDLSLFYQPLLTDMEETDINTGTSTVGQLVSVDDILYAISLYGGATDYQTIDTLSLDANILSISLANDGVAPSTIDLSPLAVEPDITAHLASVDDHPGYMLESNIGTGADMYIQLNSSGALPFGIGLDALSDVSGFGTEDTVLHDNGDGTYSFQAISQSSVPVSFYGSLVGPQSIYDNDSTNHAVTIASNLASGFTVSRITVSCDADPTTEPTITFAYKAAGVGYGSATTIEAVTTSAGVATVTTGFDNDTIPDGSKIFMTISDPDDALNEISWSLEGE
jgi:hypothetical protein